MKYFSLVCVPLVVFPEKSYPKVVIFYFDKFNNSVCFLWEIDIVPSIFVSGSVIFKVCFDFNMLWKIVLLSSVNSLVLVKFSDEYYCCQDVTGVVLYFKDVRGKPDLC